MARSEPAPTGPIVVVGAGLAGLRAAQELRRQGFDGELIVVGAERHRPYDRPPLSKDLLLGTTTPADIALLPAEQESELQARWLLGRTVTGIDGHTVLLDERDRIEAAGVVLATGATARRLPLGRPPGVRTLRTVDDAVALRDALRPGTRLTIAGAGLIGAEVAAAARGRDVAVTLVEMDPRPFARAFGQRAAEALQAMHTRHGVRLLAGAGIRGAAGADRIRSVTLTDGRRLPTDVLLVSIGAEPDTGFLAGSGVACDRGVLTDPAGRTSVPWIVAAGDVARYRTADADLVRYEHWTNARDMPVVAVAALLGDLRGTPSGAVHSPVPYFWSDQYGSRLQVAGTVGPNDTIRLIEGAADGPFVLLHERHGVPVAVVARDSPRTFVRQRRQLRRPALPPPAT